MPPPRHWLALVGALVALLAAQPALAEDTAPRGKIDYARQVKPLLAARCFRCHGTLKQESDLRLDTADAIRQGGSGGPAIVPGDGAQSNLILALRGEGGLTRMPAEGEPLTEEEIARIAAWIDQGAEAPPEQPPPDPRQHWAFQPPVRPHVPVVKDADWVRTPIDAFLAARHEALGLTPRPEAPQHVLLRRLFIDLTGLPPTRAELHAWLADPSDAAYERLVDQLLASPRYGERWGRHWMDVWRYSDWDGYGAEIRESQPHIWRWRDWIVESLNQDKPYDRMLLEMLAADEIAPTDEKLLRATGYLGRSWYKFNRNTWLENAVEHTSKAFLGVTLNCARCHDHMYDPIPQRSFYEFRAFFEPYDVRLDRLPGQLDTAQDGLARVYDANTAAATYLFVRGNEAMPATDQALAPAVPEILGNTELSIQPVNLPPQAYYPALRPFVQEESLAEARAQVEAAKTTLAQACDALRGAEAQLAALADPNAQPTDQIATSQTVEAARAAVEAARLAAAIAERSVATAEVNVAAVEARIAADNARYADPPAADAEALAAAANAVERQLAVLNAETALLTAEQQLAAARAALNEADEATKQALTAAEATLAQAQSAVTAAQEALTAPPAATYTPLGAVYPATSSGRRTALARWIADRRNPLTARVAVNHIWLRHFGEPLVPTVFDLGLGGRPPAHPELLDWLAVELMDSGWSMKRVHRLIVRSSAYRRDSAFRSDDPNLAIDPDNRQWWRFPSRRAESEVVRDSVLAVAGSLDLTMGGPDIDQNLGLTVPRRSIYFRHSKEKQVTMLSLFDAPGPTECYRRNQSIAPQQALALANSSLALAQSRLLASRLSAEVGAGSEADGAFVAAAYETVLSRAPSEAETAECREFLVRQAELLASGQLVGFASGQPGPVPPSAEPAQRARENLVHVLLNHHEFVTIR